MSKNISNESEMINEYLKKMDDCVFLSKKEEQVIGRRIKKVEKKILKACLKSEIFIEELEKVCDAVIRNKNNSIKYSKKLIDDSPREDKWRIADYFSQIKQILGKEKVTKADKVLISKLVSYIEFTSSAINQMILPLKNKCTKVKSLENRSKKIFNFLEVESLEEYNKLAIDCQDPYFRNKLCRRLYTTDSTLVKKLRSQEEILKFYSENGLDQSKIEKLNSLISDVNKLEKSYKEDRETLINANLPLVVSRAKRFNNSEMSLEDIIQEGNIGLIKAVDKYDPDKNVKITTYATWWIDQAIRRSISNKAKTIRVPAHVQQLLRELNQAFFKLSQKLLREPTLEEISKFTEIPLNQIHELNEISLHEVGLDSEISQGLSYTDILFDRDQKSVFHNTARTMLKNKIRIALADLSPRSQKIIMLRFGIGMISDHTLEEIGNKFSMTKQRIRVLESEALRDLKKNKKLTKDK